MALQLPKGRQVLFAAAPDALDPAMAECLAPLETEANFVGAGYEEGMDFCWDVPWRKKYMEDGHQSRWIFGDIGGWSWINPSIGRMDGSRYGDENKGFQIFSGVEQKIKLPILMFTKEMNVLTHSHQFSGFLKIGDPKLDHFHHFHSSFDEEIREPNGPSKSGSPEPGSRGFSASHGAHDMSHLEEPEHRPWRTVIGIHWNQKDHASEWIEWCQQAPELLASGSSNESWGCLRGLCRRCNRSGLSWAEIFTSTVGGRDSGAVSRPRHPFQGFLNWLKILFNFPIVSSTILWNLGLFSRISPRFGHPYYIPWTLSVAPCREDPSCSCRSIAALENGCARNSRRDGVRWRRPWRHIPLSRAHGSSSPRDENGARMVCLGRCHFFGGVPGGVPDCATWLTAVHKSSGASCSNCSKYSPWVLRWSPRVFCCDKFAGNLYFWA